jgi:hypothetical protein
MPAGRRERRRPTARQREIMALVGDSRTER